MGIEKEAVESEITPNRGDCLCLRGIAREFSAKTSQEIASLAITDIKVAKSSKFRVETPHCRAYTGAIVSNLDQSEPAAEILARNYILGVHSVNPVVDVLSYVTHELGQPFHAFDLDLVQLPLVIKEADKSTVFKGIQGQDIKVEPGDIVIVDQTGKVKALAGIMGSLDSAVTSKTQQIFLEAAHFCSKQIAKTLRRIKISTDSSFRFERGIDEGAISYCTQRLLHILKQSFNCRVDYFFSTVLSGVHSKSIILSKNKHGSLC